MSKIRKVKQTINQSKFPPSSLVQVLDPDAWENFIEDCCRIQKEMGEKYVYVQKLGGAGDAGRDVEARYVSDLLEKEWDLYQGKHYQKAIGESILYPELVKVFHHIKLGTYPAPNNYYVCAPRNTTPKLHDLIAKPHQLKENFLKAWKEAKHGISLSKFPFDDSVKVIVEMFDFSSIREYPVKDLIAIHQKDTTRHALLFGVEPAREENGEIPLLPADHEQTYLQEILNAYKENDIVSKLTLSDAFSSPEYGEHLNACRTEFYSADGLKRFSQEIYPGEFDKLLSEVHSGIKRLISNPKFDNGMDRMDAVLDYAGKMNVSANPLSKQMYPADLPGTCHHLVNGGKIKWVKLKT